MDSEILNSDERILIGEAIVSVVTTKSVVNGTISIPTYSPMTTEQMDGPLIESTSESPQSSPASPTSPSSASSPSSGTSPTAPETPTTEDSIIVASVQTSRSISGARFLPFDLTGSPRKPLMNTTDEDPQKSPIESTESIIDKLDRVQSELSSVLLTGGFRNTGNALQLDVLSEQRPTPSRKTFTTTGKSPIISKFVPKRQNDRKPTTEVNDEEVTQPSIPIARSKPSFKWPSRSKLPTTEPRLTTKRPKVKDEAQDITAFLPPGFKLKNEDKTTEKSLLSEIFARSKINSSITEQKEPESIQTLFSKSSVDISAFLPAGYKPVKVEEKKLTTTSSPIQKTLQELFSKSSADIAGLLPNGYKDVDMGDRKNETGMITTVESTSKAPGGVKLVFPSRPGGRKAIHKAVTPSRANDAPTAVTPKIQKGWPVR